ncbi:MAG: RluA family pseudouridine synthase [Bacteroidetes bacterium]|nr:RluA family pseudouridine synthase [Bacteroidota bacterium]
MEASEEREEYTLFEFIADAGQRPLRIDKFIVDRIEGITRTKVQSGIQEERVLVNGSVVKANYKVRPGDRIRIVVSEEPKEYEVKPENIPLNVVYEDDVLMVINKPAGIAVHPGVGNYSGTISNALAHYFNDGIHQMNRHPYLVHRIDKNTSGLLLIGKTEASTKFLADQFKAHTTTRKYNALVWGVPEKAEGTITGNIGRSTRERQVFTVVGDEEGKHATTHYRVLEDYTYTSLIECELETGRTHQIRVHLKHLGHPLFSDEKYGGRRIRKGVVFSKYKQFVENCFQRMPRHALHAKTLGFVHPVTKEYMHFDSEWPDDFADVVDRWRKISENYSFE